MSQPHDSGYKLLFSSPLLVRDLIQGFIHDPWLDRLDFSTLEAVKGQYVSEDMRGRADDVVWRVKVDGDWLYLYLLIEFQSSVDRFMALRMMVYVGLLYQDLLRQGQVGPDRLLPPVLPIVLYNGEPRWVAPVALDELLPKVPAFLGPLQPRMRFVLIDEGTYPPEVLDRLPQNLVAAVFRLEQPQTPEVIEEVVRQIEASTRSPEYEPVRRLVAIWIRASLKRNRKYPILLPELDDLQELSVSLSQRIEQWAEGFIATGKLQGQLEGRLEGEARVLARLLARRFGRLPDWVGTRLAGASETDLERWADAVLEAGSLAEVFDDSGTGH